MTIRRDLRVVNGSQWLEVRCKEFTGFSCAKKNATGWRWVSASFNKPQLGDRCRGRCACLAEC